MSLNQKITRLDHMKSFIQTGGAVETEILLGRHDSAFSSDT